MAIVGKVSGACARTTHKLMSDDLQALSDRQLRTRRQRPAACVERVELTLPGSLVRQGRRCASRDCRCRQGELHDPYLYVALYLGGRCMCGSPVDLGLQECPERRGRRMVVPSAGG